MTAVDWGDACARNTVGVLGGGAGGVQSGSLDALPAPVDGRGFSGTGVRVRVLGNN